MTIGRVSFALCGLMIAASAGCSRHAAPPSGPPPIPVTVGHVTRGGISTFVSFDGQITPNFQTTLSTAEAGTIASVDVVEGQFVHRGDLLATLDTSQLQAQLKANDATVREGQAEVVHSNVAAPVNSQQYESGVSTAEQNLQSAKNSVRSSQSQLASDSLTQSADFSLYKQGYVSTTAYEQARAAYVAAMENLTNRLLPSLHFQWTGISLDETRSGATTLLIFALGLTVEYLVLAALYESLGDPLVVLLSVPAALLGAVGALLLRHITSDVYAQVGYVMLIGLAAKNAILIVEFSIQQRAAGKPAAEAVVAAATTRLRPILMTSVAFIAGLIPLVFASGAGATSRHSLGTAVIGGMIVSTVVNLIVVPAMYLIVDDIGSRLAKLLRSKFDDSAAAPASA